MTMMSSAAAAPEPGNIVIATRLSSLIIIVTQFASLIAASTAILAAYDISLECDLRPQDVIVYTFGCPAQGNVTARVETEKRLPNCFNVINNSDVIYFSGKQFGLFKVKMDERSESKMVLQFRLR